MTDYTELLLQVSDVMRKHNRVVYRGINSVLPPPMTDEEAVKLIRDIVTPKGKWEYTTHYARRYRVCPLCKAEKEDDHATGWNFCQYCGARMSDQVQI